MKLFLLGLLVSLNVFAAKWSELEEGRTYKLNQSFALPQTERSGSLLELMKGDTFYLKEISPLELHFPVTLYIFKYNNCPGPALKTSMELITVEQTKVEVGATVEDRELNVFVETKDTLTNSFFE